MFIMIEHPCQEDAHPPVYIIVLGLLVKAPIRPTAMNHSATHRDGGTHYAMK
jgi:hypothetical protein